MTVPLLDASVWLAAMDPRDRFHESSVRVVESGARREVGTLDLALYEAANVAVRRWRDPHGASALAALIAMTVGDLLVRVDQRLVGAAIALADEEGLSAYDAAYVASARAAGWQLVSTDLRDLVAPGFAVSPEEAVATDA